MVKMLLKSWKSVNMFLDGQDYLDFFLIKMLFRSLEFFFLQL